jgi:arabinose-5-phosphate isomerase
MKKTIRAVFDNEITALIHARDSVDNSYVEAVKLLNRLPDKSRVVLLGTGKSGHIARKISATFASTGTPSFFLHPNEAGHGDMGMLSNGDIAILISQSGNNDDLLEVLSFLKRNSIPSIGLVGNKNSPLANLCDICISTWVAKEACPLNLAPTTSTTLTLVIGDCLAVALMELKGFSQRDFANTHPFGSLGKKLFTKVSDVMVNFQDSPVVTENALFFDAISTMNSCGLGAIIVVDCNIYPVGILTDGDLRRIINTRKIIENIPILDIMKESFHKVNQDEMAINAVNIFEQMKISFLPVVNDQQALVGCINLRMILQRKII